MTLIDLLLRLGCVMVAWMVVYAHLLWLATVRVILAARDARWPVDLRNHARRLVGSAVGAGAGADFGRDRHHGVAPLAAAAERLRRLPLACHPRGWVLYKRSYVWLKRGVG